MSRPQSFPIIHWRSQRSPKPQAWLGPIITPGWNEAASPLVGLFISPSAAPLWSSRSFHQLPHHSLVSLLWDVWCRHLTTLFNPIATATYTSLIVEKACPSQYTLVLSSNMAYWWLDCFRLDPDLETSRTRTAVIGQSIGWPLIHHSPQLKPRGAHSAWRCSWDVCGLPHPSRRNSVIDLNLDRVLLSTSAAVCYWDPQANSPTLKNSIERIHAPASQLFLM